MPEDSSFLVALVVPKILEGKPLEEIYLIRDETANMVWGIETQIPLPSGDTKPIENIKPQTALLREGLGTNPPSPYFINEEEVPRAWIQVKQSFQRTRWYGGKVLTWLGVRKQTGRGEGASGLAFDQLVATAKKGGE